MATATAKSTRTFEVACPLCGDADASLTIELNDLGSISCSSCDESFSPRQAAARAAEALKRWESIAAWVEAAGGFLDASE